MMRLTSLVLVIGLFFVISVLGDTSYAPYGPILRDFSLDQPLLHSLNQQDFSLYRHGVVVSSPLSIVQRDTHVSVWFSVSDAGNYTLILDTYVVGNITLVPFSSVSNFTVTGDSGLHVYPGMHYSVVTSSTYPQLRFTVTHYGNVSVPVMVSSPDSFLHPLITSFVLAPGNSKDVFVRATIGDNAVYEGTVFFNSFALPVLLYTDSSQPSLVVNNTNVSFAVSGGVLRFLGKSSILVSLRSDEVLHDGVLTLHNVGNSTVTNIAVTLTGGLEEIMEISPLFFSRLAPDETLTLSVSFNSQKNLATSYSGSLVVTSSSSSVNLPVSVHHVDTQETVAEICDNTIDDDSDGFVDCLDDTCAFASYCHVDTLEGKDSSVVITHEDEPAVEESSYGLYIVLVVLLLLLIGILLGLYHKGKKRTQEFNSFVSQLQRRQ